MTRRRDEIDEEALDWAVRSGDPEFANWQELTGWLEQSPDHAARYHAIMLVTEHAAASLPANDVCPLPVRQVNRRRWLAAGLAAALVGAVSVGVLQIRPQPYTIETAPGMSRTVPLADGSRIHLNGGTRVKLDRREARLATLERGEALFEVRHDKDRPFAVTVGDTQLVDLGTVFDVVHVPAMTRVGVAEGAVMANPGGERVRIVPGQVLRISATGMRLAQVEPRSIGSWRQQRLDYDGAPLNEVLADVSRATGLSLSAAPDVMTRPFRGTISLQGLRDDPARLAALLDLDLRAEGSGWVFTARQ